MHIKQSFQQKSPLHGKFAELVQAGHQMAKAGSHGSHKQHLVAKLQQLGTHLDTHHAGRQEHTLKQLLAEATHDKLHTR